MTDESTIAEDKLKERLAATTMVDQLYWSFPFSFFFKQDSIGVNYLSETFHHAIMFTVYSLTYKKQFFKVS